MRVVELEGGRQGEGGGAEGLLCVLEEEEEEEKVAVCNVARDRLWRPLMQPKRFNRNEQMSLPPPSPPLQPFSFFSSSFRLRDKERGSSSARGERESLANKATLFLLPTAEKRRKGIGGRHKNSIPGFYITRQ